MATNKRSKNSKRGNKPKQHPGSEAYTQTLLEELHSQFRVFGEGLEFTNQHIARLEEKVGTGFAEAGTRFAKVEKKMDATFNEVGLLRVDMEVVKSDVSELKSDVSHLKSDVSELKSDMVVAKDELHIIRGDLKEKVGRDEFGALDRRIIHLEGRSKTA